MSGLSDKEVYASDKDVVPGYFYDDVTRTFSPCKEKEKIDTTDCPVSFNFSYWKQDFLNNFLSRSKSKTPWVNDYHHEKATNAILVKGCKCLERRGVQTPLDNVKYKVTSIFYKYNCDMLIILAENITEEFSKELHEYLFSVVNESKESFIPKVVSENFTSAYVYPKLGYPGKRLPSVKYALEEFCHVLKSTPLHKWPSHAWVKAPMANVTVTKSVNDTTLANINKHIPQVHSNKIKPDEGINNVKNNYPIVERERDHRTNETQVDCTRDVNNVDRGRGVETKVGKCRSFIPEAHDNGGCNASNINVEDGGSNTQTQGESCNRNNNRKTHKESDAHMATPYKIQENKSVSMNAHTTVSTTTITSTIIAYDKNVQSTNIRVESITNNLENTILDEHNGNKTSDTYAYDLQPKENSLNPNYQANLQQSTFTTPGENTSMTYNFPVYADDLLEKGNKEKVTCDATSTSNAHMKIAEDFLKEPLDDCKRELAQQNVCKKGSKIESKKKQEMEIHNTLQKESEKSKTLVQNTSKDGHKFSKGAQQDQNDSLTSTSKMQKQHQEGSSIDEKDNSNLVKSGATLHNELQSENDLNTVKSIEEPYSASISKKEPKRKAETDIGNLKSERVGKNAPKADHKPSKETRQDSIPSVPSTSKKQRMFQQGLDVDEKDNGSLLKATKQDAHDLTTKRKQATKYPNMKSKFIKPLKTIQDPCGLERKYYKYINDTYSEKVIILLGASGSGKTTLVNFIANYFMDCKSADGELVHVDTISHTSAITAYTFCSDCDEIPITVIDTPGLNDSSGGEVRDHVQSLKTFLANATSKNFDIHAIGFVVQAHLVRLTPSERLVMDCVSTMFGQSVSEHLITLVTFADSQANPPVLEAMENYKVGSKLSLMFNNSTLSNCELDEVDDLDRVYWRKCHKSWKKCLKTLRELPPLSVNTVKAIQSEIFTERIIESAEEDLRSELKTFFTFCKKGSTLSKDTLEVCEKIWELAAVVYRLKYAHNTAVCSVENIMINFGKEICTEMNISPGEYVNFLSLAPSRSLTVAGIEIICAMVQIYGYDKQWHMVTKDITEVSYCQMCKAEHKMKREDKDKSYWKTRTNEITLKCVSVNCNCSSSMHGVSEVRSPLHPDYVLSFTRKQLCNILERHSLQKFVVGEKLFLIHLNQHNFYHNAPTSPNVFTVVSVNAV